jgi:hypothetical protein
VPADWAINDGMQIANNRHKSATSANCEQSTFLDLIFPFSFFDWPSKAQGPNPIHPGAS